MEHFKKPIETIVRDLKKPFQFSKAYILYIYIYIYIYRRIQSFFFFFLSFCFRMVDNKSTKLKTSVGSKVRLEHLLRVI